MRLHPRNTPCHCYRTESHIEESTLYRGYHHGDLRVSATAVCPHRPHLLAHQRLRGEEALHRGCGEAGDDLLERYEVRGAGAYPRFRGAHHGAAAEGLSNETFYLIEPSKIKLNKLLSKNPRALVNAKGKKIVLNKCMLSNQDVADFEYETKLSVNSRLPALSDQSDSNEALDGFLNKLGFYKQVSVIKKKTLFK